MANADDEDDDDELLSDGTSDDEAPYSPAIEPRPFTADELETASREASFSESLLKRYLGYKPTGERPPKARDFVQLFELSTEEAEAKGIPPGDFKRAKKFCADIAASDFNTLWPDYNNAPPTCTGCAYVAAIRVMPRSSAGGVSDGEVELVENPPAHRWKWDDIEKRVKDKKKGGWKIKRPFLKHNNWKDILFVRKLLVECPWDAPYGDKIKSWEDFAEAMKGEKTPQGTMPYEEGVGFKTLKKRFEAYIIFVKKYEGNIPFRSGTDDEKPPTELLQGLEDLYELCTSFEDEKDEKDRESAAQKKLDRKKAEAIKLASLDSMKGRNLAKSIMQEEGKDKKKTSDAPTKKKKKFDYDTMMLDMQEEMKESAALQKERQKARDERKKRKLEIQQESQQMEREKFELDKKEREAQLDLLKALTSKLG